MVCMGEGVVRPFLGGGVHEGMALSLEYLYLLHGEPSSGFPVFVTRGVQPVYYYKTQSTHKSK